MFEQVQHGAAKGLKAEGTMLETDSLDEVLQPRQTKSVRLHLTNQSALW